MNFRILLAVLLAFSFLLAGCGGKKADAGPAEPMEGIPDEEPEPDMEEENEEAEELAGLFDIEINEPPEDFDYGKAPGEE